MSDSLHKLHEEETLRVDAFQPAPFNHSRFNHLTSPTTIHHPAGGVAIFLLLATVLCYPEHRMFLRAYLRCIIWVVLCAAWPVWAQAQPQTLKLADGGVVVGRIISAKDQFVQVALDTGGGAPS